MRAARLTSGVGLVAGLVLAATGCDAGPPPPGYTGPSAIDATSSVPGASAAPTDASDPATAQPTRSRSPRASESTRDSDPAGPEGSGGAPRVPTTPAAPTSVPTFAATSTDAPAAAGAPRSYAEAVERVSARRGGSAQQKSRFSTPGDRIYCVLGDEVLGTACELRGGGVEDADVCAGTPGDRVGRLELTRAGVIPQCNTDTIREPGAPTITPDARIVGGTVTCAVEAIGVTCVDEEKRLGFFLAPGRYATFG